MPVSEKPRPKRTRRMAREPQLQEPAASLGNEPSPALRLTKAQIVLDLLQRSAGCSLDELVAATGWLPHTTRAFLTGLKKKGHDVTSDKRGQGPRTYRILPAGVGQ